MNIKDAAFLVSCPNYGGLFFVNGEIAQRVDGFDSAGLAFNGKILVRGFQDGKLAMANLDGSVRLVSRPGVNDVHDVLFVADDRVMVVSTETNSVVLMTTDGEIVERWKIPGEPDSAHLNCIDFLNGRIAVSAFSTSTLHRAYKEEDDGHGFIFDLDDGSTLFDGLTQPHGLVEFNSNVVVANSGLHQILVFDKNRERIREVNLGGYTRGLTVVDDLLLVGVSSSRNTQPDEGSNARVVFLNTQYEIVSEIELPTREIYEIVPVRTSEIPDVLSLSGAITSVRIRHQLLGGSTDEIAFQTTQLVEGGCPAASSSSPSEGITGLLEEMRTELTQLLSAQTLSSEKQDGMDALASRLKVLNRNTLELHESVIDSNSKLEKVASFTHYCDDITQKLRAVADGQIKISSSFFDQYNEIDRRLSLLGESDSRAISGLADQYDQIDRRLRRITETQDESLEFASELRRDFKNLNESISSTVALGSEISKMTAKLAEMELEKSQAEMLVVRDRAKKDEEIVILGVQIVALKDEVRKLKLELENLAARLEVAESENIELTDSLRIRQDECTTLSNQLSELQTVLESSRDMAAAIEVEKSKQIAQLESSLQSKDSSQNVLVQEMSMLQTSLGQALELNSAIENQNTGLVTALNDAKRREEILVRQSQLLDDRITHLEAELTKVYSSLSVRMTKPVRDFVNLFRKRDPIDDKNALLETPASEVQPNIEQVKAFFDIRNASNGIVVLTTKHCLFIAELFQSALARVNVVCEIIFEQPENGYRDVPHIVICPQFFEKLPGFYSSFQLEQSVSSRWFTPEYFKALENSFTVFDYSLKNIEYLCDSGLSLAQTYYLPLGYLSSLHQAPSNVDQWEYDIIFYGDINNERRRRYIDELRKHFNVRVVSEVFGDELRAALASAPILVNIHYYEGALLETTRVWEALSCGKIVLSEKSSDQDEHSELDGIVEFVDMDDLEGMVNRARELLSDREAILARVNDQRSELQHRYNWFDYYFYRFMLASDNLNFEEFWDLVGSTYPVVNRRLCLNLPESPKRAQSFRHDNKYGFELFRGLRHSKGWIGCGLSFKFMASLAQREGIEQLVVCEDDVEFPIDFEQRFSRVEGVLNSSEQWDIYSGLMSDLHPETKVDKVIKANGETIARVNKVISTVFNVYAPETIRQMADWDMANRDVHTNTIDRYLEANSSHHILVSNPYLVGHKEDLDSTIWGFGNQQYVDMIAKSSSRLAKLISDFRRRKWWS